MPSPELKIAFQVDIIVKPDGDGFHAFCPSLKGLHMDGKTKDEALENAKVAIIAYLLSLIKHNDPIPIHFFVIKEKDYKQLVPHNAQRYTERISLPAFA